MICPTCQTEFTPKTKNGYTTKFCSRSCGNTRSYSDEQRLKHSDIMLGHFRSESAEQIKYRIQKSIATKHAMRETMLADAVFDDLSNPLKRRRIQQEQDSCCAICKLPAVWLDKPLTLHLDHINGDRTNNSRTNLRLICPNCHSQTDTYCVKNVKRVTPVQIIKASIDDANVHKICKTVGLQLSGYTYKRIKNILKPT